jgi:hypothetical protein
MEYEAPHPPHEHHRVSGVREPNAFLLFIFSFLPGANYMYMGLIKRGLFVMSSFFLLCYLSAAFNSVLIGLAIPVLVITAFFDGFNIRRRIIAGASIPDDVEDILGVPKRHKTAFVIGAILFLAAGAAESLRHFFIFGMHNRTFSWVVLIAIIAFAALYALGSSKARARRRLDRKNDDNEI